MSQINSKVKKISKAEIYASYGIEYKGGKIHAPEFGWINPLLVNGNSKLGAGVWTFSMLPGTAVYNFKVGEDEHWVQGTCPCDCKGCYAKSGFYNMPSVLTSNAVKTYLARNYPEFVENAIIAQVHADGIKLLRIHASGDFFNRDYINMWKTIVGACEDCVFWTYTKNPAAENAFTGYDNINIVKSIVKGHGFNFGKCGYIIKVYNALKDAGEDVYICRCGIDKNQHCVNCKGCSANKYVLFIEHSTDYVAENDPLFPELKAIIEAQSRI